MFFAKDTVFAWKSAVATFLVSIAMRIPVKMAL
jgi:hypothetical protein